MALVVDLGSKTCRMGWSGEAKPQHVVASRSLALLSEGDHFIQKGLISDWSQLETVWSSIFTACQADSKETPVLFADYPATKDCDREKMSESLFEKFSIPHYFVANQSVLSLYSCGRTSAIIIDAGYGTTNAMAIHEGYAYPHTIERMEVGGADIALYLANLMQDRGLDTSSMDLDNLQEQVSQVPLDFIQESARLRAHPEEQPALTLPDGNTVSLVDEHLRCGEVLFQPGLVGVDGAGLDERLWDIIRVCDSDKEGGPMRSLPQCVLLSGGLSQMPGLVPRVRAELEKRSAASRGYFIAALPQDDARNAAWIGGSILPALPGFVASNFVSLSEYKELGPAALHRRC
jgi:actin-related protein